MLISTVGLPPISPSLNSPLPFPQIYHLSIVFLFFEFGLTNQKLHERKNQCAATKIPTRLLCIGKHINTTNDDKQQFYLDTFFIFVQTRTKPKIYCTLLPKRSPQLLEKRRWEREREIKGRKSGIHLKEV